MPYITHSYTRYVVCALFTLCLSLGALTTAVHATPPAEKTIGMDFKNADIHVLIKFISQLTGKNFIVDRSVRGKVTVYSPTQISVSQAYKVFLSILEVNQFTVVPASGDMYKILPISQAKNRSIRTLTTKPKHDLGDEVVTQIITLKHSSSAELAKLLPSVIGDRGTVTPYVPNNTLVVTAPYSLVQRVLKITREVDRFQYAPQFKSFYVTNGSASQIVSEINKLMSAMSKEREKSGHNSLSLLEADNRVNKILVLADAESMRTIARMVDQLDEPTPKGKGDIHMVRLENADAEDVAKVLNTLITNASTTPKEEGEANAKILNKNAKVVADKPTNSLIITAQPGDFETLGGIIADLDTLRSQIFIEALIMEVSSDAEFKFGINWGGGRGGDASFFGASNFGGSSGLSFSKDPNIISVPSGASIGMLLDEAIKVGGVSYGIPAILNLTKGSNDFRILSTPQLMTLDNQQAKVDIVDNIPFVKEVTTSAVTKDYQSQGIDYRDVGVRLQITPHIGSQGTLRLEVKQEVSRVVDSQIETGGQRIVAPSTKKRTVETTIQMRDGETAVIAGLISEQQNNNKSKLPGLGDIPALGWLFKGKTEKDVRTNLFVFITPKIVASYKDSLNIARKKRETIQDVERGKPSQLKPVPSKMIAPAPIMVR